MGALAAVAPTARRRARSAGLALLLALGWLASAPATTLTGGAHAAEADEAEEFRPGRGEARGTGVRLGPSRSGFNFTTDFAVSLADFQKSVARGDSRGVDLGMIIETAAEAVDEEGEYLPSNLRIDSRDEGAADGVQRNDAGTPDGSPARAAVGEQFVRATEDPFAEVETVMGSLGLEGALTLEGGTSRATAGVVDAGQREARGRASFERVVLGGGAVVLEGLEWEAVHRSGAQETASGAFRLGNIEIAEQSLLPDEASEQGAQALTEALEAANEALSELGLNLEAPREIVDEDSGRVEMTPLRLSIGPSEPSRQVAGPLMDALQPVREPLADALIDANESFGAVFLLFDVATGALAGGGEMVVEIGGAQAVTAAGEVYDNPFGDDFGQELGAGLDEPSEPASSGDGPELGADASGGGLPGDATGGGTGADAPAPETSPAPETAEEPPADIEEPAAAAAPDAGEGGGEPQAATPAASAGARGGAALLAALLALLVAGALGGVDHLRLRQARRTIPG